jgi:hypothetical protein
MAKNNDPVGSELGLQVASDLMRIQQELLHRHFGCVEIARVGFARAALVPVDNHEITLQRPCGRVGERHLRSTRPAMKPQEYRGRSVLAADQQPLRHAADLDLFQNRDWRGASRDCRRPARKRLPGKPEAGNRKQKEYRPAHD